VLLVLHRLVCWVLCLQLLLLFCFRAVHGPCSLVTRLVWSPIQ
jgi:hypothetical protein